MLAGSITRKRAPLVADPYSGESTTRDWANAASLVMDGFAVAPGASTEAPTVNRESVTTEPTLYGPHGADIVRFDRVEANGRTWDVTGHRADWANPWTSYQMGASWPLRLVEC